jgi:hypothetical protein
MALVAGRNRVPSPATGKTALRIGFMASPGLCYEPGFAVGRGIAEVQGRTDIRGTDEQA